MTTIPKPASEHTAATPERLRLFRLEQVVIRMNHRIDAARERKSETIGVGLLLATDIVDACNGAIEALRTTSEVGEKELARVIVMVSDAIINYAHVEEIAQALLAQYVVVRK